MSKDTNTTIDNCVSEPAVIEQEYPSGCYCPLTKQVMKNPAILFDGMSFERSAIEAHFAENNTHPITQEQLTEEQKRLYSNYALKNALKHLKSNVEVMPAEYKCPITKMIMVSPCLLEDDDQTYEQEAIEEWLKTSNISPIGLKLSRKALIPNLHLQALIKDYLKDHPVLYDNELDVYLPQSYINGFSQAVISIDLKAIKSWLAKDKRLLNKPLDEGGKTALHFAVINKKAALARLLIEQGAIKDNTYLAAIVECYFLCSSKEISLLLAEYFAEYDAEAFHQLSLKFLKSKNEKSILSWLDLLKKAASFGSVQAKKELLTGRVKLCHRRYNTCSSELKSFITAPAQMLAYPIDVIAALFGYDFGYHDNFHISDSVIFKPLNYLHVLPDYLKVTLLILFGFIIPLILFPAAFLITVLTMIYLPLMKIIGYGIIEIKSWWQGLAKDRAVNESQQSYISPALKRLDFKAYPKDTASKCTTSVKDASHTFFRELLQQENEENSSEIKKDKRDTLALEPKQIQIAAKEP